MSTSFFATFLLIFDKFILTFISGCAIVPSNGGEGLSSENRKIYIAAGALQAVHVVLYLTGLLDKIAQINVYIAFGICAVVSIICVLMSGWMLLPFSKFTHGIKYLLLFIAILQVISTIIIFLLPEN